MCCAVARTVRLGPLYLNGGITVDRTSAHSLANVLGTLGAMG